MRARAWAAPFIALVLMAGTYSPSLCASAREYLQQARAAERMGDYEKAVDLFTQAMRYGASDADAYFRRGLSYEK